MNIPDNVTEIMTHLIKHGYKAYVIGGAVRDTLLGIEPHDWDLFTNADGDDILRLFPDGKVLGGEERQEKILTVIVNGIEVSQFRSNGDRTETGTTLKEHQATCDFTINSIAMDINGNITDPNNGVEHLDNNILKFVGNYKDRVAEDKLRILRYIRFLYKYNLYSNDAENEYVKNNLHLLKEIPVERVTEELIKILSIPNLYIVKNDELILLLREFFPELKDAKNFVGGRHHKETVDVHQFNSFKEAIALTTNPFVRLATHLHDIGKPSCHSVDENGEDHYYEHEKKGAEIVEDTMTAMKFSGDQVKFVGTMIRLHMYTYKDEPSKKSYIKFFNKLNDANIAIEDYIVQIYCDHQGNLAKPRIKFVDFIKNNWLYKEYQHITYSDEPMTVKDLKIGGKDLIERYGMEPGPKFAEILNDVYDKVMDGDLVNERANIFEYLNKKMVEK